MTFSRGFDIREGGVRTSTYTLSPVTPPRGRVVFVHGTGNEALYPHIGLFKVLLRMGYEVRASDLDGHGREGRGRFDPEQVRSAVPRMIERALAAGTGPVHAIGESLGASLLLDALAADDPPLASAAAISPPETIRVTPAAVGREIGGMTLGALHRLSAEYGWFGMIPAFGPVRRSTFPIRSRHGTGLGYLDEVRETLTRLDLVNRAREISTPVLLIGGLADRIVDPGHSVRLHRVLPRSDLALFPGRGHLGVSIDARTDARMVGWIVRWGQAGAGRRAPGAGGARGD